MAAEIKSYILQGFYFGEWEDLTADDSLKGIRESRKDYVQNEGGVYRVQVEFKSGRRRHTIE